MPFQKPWQVRFPTEERQALVCRRRCTGSLAAIRTKLIPDSFHGIGVTAQVHIGIAGHSTGRMHGGNFKLFGA